MPTSARLRPRAGPPAATQELTPVHQAMLQRLQQLHGDSFDRTFAFGQVGDHEKDILANLWQSEHAQSPQVTQYAQQQVPVLQEHLQLARQTSEQWVSQAQTAGEKMAPQGTMQQQRTPAGH